MCNFMREILTTLYNEQMHTSTWDEDEQITEEDKKSIKNLRIVKESFLLSFFHKVLTVFVQKVLLEKSNQDLRSSYCDRARTILQYLMEILCLVNDKSLAKVTYAFLFNYTDILRHLYISSSLSS